MSGRNAYNQKRDTIWSCTLELTSHREQIIAGAQVTTYALPSLESLMFSSEMLPWGKCKHWIFTNYHKQGVFQWTLSHKNNGTAPYRTSRVHDSTVRTSPYPTKYPATPASAARSWYGRTPLSPAFIRLPTDDLSEALPWQRRARAVVSTVRVCAWGDRTFTSQIHVYNRGEKETSISLPFDINAARRGPTWLGGTIVFTTRDVLFQTADPLTADNFYPQG